MSHSNPLFFEEPPKLQNIDNNDDLVNFELEMNNNNLKPNQEPNQDECIFPQKLINFSNRRNSISGRQQLQHRYKPLHFDGRTDRCRFEYFPSARGLHQKGALHENFLSTQVGTRPS